MAIRTLSNAGGNWNSTSTWVEAAVPTSADDVVATGTSGPLTLNVNNAVCQSFDMSLHPGGTGVPLTFSAASQLSVGSASGGDLLLSNLALHVVTNGGTVKLVSTSTHGGTGWNIDLDTEPAGTTFPAIVIDGIGGKWRFLGSKTVTLWTGSARANFTLTNGYLNLQNVSIDCAQFNSVNSNTRTLDFSNVNNGTTRIDCSTWNITTTGLTEVSGGLSAVSLRQSSGTASFTGGGLTYGQLHLLTTSTAYTIQGSNTYTTVDAFGGTSVTFEAGSTTTILTDFDVNGFGSALTVGSSVPGTAWNLVKGAGASVTCDLLTLSDSHASGGATFLATNSTDGGGNTGWQFPNTFAATITDAVGGVDAAVRVSTALSATTNPVGLVDSASALVVATASATNPVGVVDSVSQASVAARAPGDLVGAVDDVTANVTNAGSGADFNVAVTDPEAVHDSYASTLSKPNTDSVGVVDASSSIATAARTATDAETLVDSTVKAANYSQTVSEVVAVPDSAGANTYVYSITDKISLSPGNFPSLFNYPDLTNFPSGTDTEVLWVVSTGRLIDDIVATVDRDPAAVIRNAAVLNEEIVVLLSGRPSTVIVGVPSSLALSESLDTADV